MHKLLLFSLVLLLTACATEPYPVSSPYYQIPPGSQVILKQALTIPPNQARSYIQYGKVIRAKDKEKYYPHCWFLSWKALDTAQTIKPDSFTVLKTQKFEEVIQIHSPFMLASLHGSIGTGFGIGMNQDDGGPTAVEYSTQLTIHSDAQPDIRQFVCSYWEDPVDGEHLTVAEIQKALGDIAQIQFNTGP